MKYKIYFERDNIKPTEVTITGEGDNCRVGSVKVNNETFLFNFQNTEENLLNTVKIKLNKFEIRKIEKID
ncbi:MAG: hypothetical protein PHN56_03450 [Candidatus Nanoarchaeia archaeon]|nr:hypothetical protein [Candidatus Nanoarchaeia archaeon]